MLGGRRNRANGAPKMEPMCATPILDTYWVREGKLLAGVHPADADPDLTRRSVEALLDAGIRTFINLTEEDEINENAKPVPGYQGALREVAEERSIEVTYARCAIPDRGVPSVWSMRRILDLIDGSIADEAPVFVHCWAGRGRTGTVVGCFLRRHGDVEGTQIPRHLAELRRGMPSGRKSSPHTPIQIRMVTHWKTGV